MGNKGGTAMFDVLRNRYVIQGCIVLEGPLAISTGEASDKTDAPVMRRKGDDQPFIPGSSFRGALRSTVERIAAGIGIPVCGLMDGNDAAKCLTVNKKARDAFSQWAEKESPKEADVAAKVIEELCPACRLFGSTYLATRLKVSDLTKCPEVELPVVLRHRVGIDRDSDTARSGAKFDGEVVERGAFKMELILENADEEAWGLLALGLLELRSGDFWVGGDLSVGAGRCRLDPLSIHQFGEDGYGLREFILSTETGLARYRTVTEPWEYITQKVRALIPSNPQEASHAQGAGESL